MERTCADGLPRLFGFTCEDCREKRQLRAMLDSAEAEAAAAAEMDAMSQKLASLLRESSKPCPSCEIDVSHAGGCAHMTCSRCGVHWCWLCRARFDSAGDTYEHLFDRHGGYHFQDEDEAHFEQRLLLL